MSDYSDSSGENKIRIVGTLAGDQVRGTKREIVERRVDVNRVRQHFQEFMEGLRQIIDVDVPSIGDFELEEITFGAEVAASGEFKLLGVGFGAEASSGVTFTLKRKHPGT
jgi:hypothetical protein